MGVWIETNNREKRQYQCNVTPCMGVWIETKKLEADLLQAKSHPVWVCGLKQLSEKLILSVGRHTLYGCVDWNRQWQGYDASLCSHTLYGCVDWNRRGGSHHAPRLVTPCMGVWIETCWSLGYPLSIDVTPCMGVWIETADLWQKNQYLRSHPVWVCGLKRI